MNNVNLVGRLVKDPELKYVGEDTAVCNFTLAVDNFINGEKGADFISCVVWGKQAENLSEYLVKGNRLGMSGKIQTRNYETDEGDKKYITEVRANSIEFLENKKEEVKENKSKSKNYKSKK